MPKETQANADQTAADAAEDRAAVEELAKALGIDALQDAEHVEEQEPAVEDAEEQTEEPT